MCKRVDGLLTKLEKTNLNNNDMDVGEVCRELNQLNLTDKDILRVMKIFGMNHKWVYLATLALFLLLFYLVVSMVISIVVTGVYAVLLLIVPSYIAMSVTLTLLLLFITIVQNRSDVI